MENRRKDMVLYGLWLSEIEGETLNKYLEKDILNLNNDDLAVIADILISAKNKGDFYKR